MQNRTEKTGTAVIWQDRYDRELVHLGTRNIGSFSWRTSMVLWDIGELFGPEARDACAVCLTGGPCSVRLTMELLPKKEGEEDTYAGSN